MNTDTLGKAANSSKGVFFFQNPKKEPLILITPIILLDITY
ncbi:hypothetical protein ACSFCM_13335 [Enterococcus gilvus]